MTITNSNYAEHLPISIKKTLPYAFSIIVAILMTTASVAGLSFSANIYPKDELMQTYLANDVVNLIIGLPSLVAAMWLTRREKLIGLLLWPGALLYVLYNYIAYIFGMSFSAFTLAFVALVLLCAYSLLDLMKKIDGNAVQTQLAGAVPERLSGGVLILFGIAFTFRAVGMIASAGTGQNTLPISEIGVLIADLVLSALWVVGGVMLIRRRPLGYTSGLGLLFSGCTLFIGLIIYLLIQPLLTDIPFLLTDVVVIAMMGLVCFIPFGLYMRGVISTEK